MFKNGEGVIFRVDETSLGAAGWVSGDDRFDGFLRGAAAVDALDTGGGMALSGDSVAVKNLCPVTNRGVGRGPVPTDVCLLDDAASGRPRSRLFGPLVGKVEKNDEENADEYGWKAYGESKNDPLPLARDRGVFSW